jgi:type VI protein secretion system component VasK
MEAPLLSLFLVRALLVATPFAAWFLWAAWARRRGKEIGATPWAWLVAVGGLLFGLSLMITTVFQSDNRGETYVPAEVTESGRVTPGRFEEKETTPR